MATTSLHGRHEVLARNVAAEQVVVRGRHAAERRVASGRHPENVKVHSDVGKLAALHLVDGAGVAQTNGEVDGALLVRICPARNGQPMARLRPDAEHVLRRQIGLDRAQHPVDVVVLLADVLGQVQLHAAEDGHGGRRGHPVRPQLPRDVVVLVLLHVPRQGGQRRLATVESIHGRSIHGRRATPRAGDDLRIWTLAVKSPEISRRGVACPPCFTPLADASQGMGGRLARAQLVQDVLESLLLAAPGVDELDVVAVGAAPRTTALKYARIAGSRAGIPRPPRPGRRAS